LETPRLVRFRIRTAQKKTDTLVLSQTAKSKKQRRLAAKALRKQQLLNPGLLEPKIPIYEQTIDLPGGDGSAQGATEALEARAELTKAMRDKRRSKIKEDNFLKEMR
jgi:large subunit ribosomal protein L54